MDNKLNDYKYLFSFSDTYNTCSFEKGLPHIIPFISKLHKNFLTSQYGSLTPASGMIVNAMAMHAKGNDYQGNKKLSAYASIVSPNCSLQ